MKRQILIGSLILLFAAAFAIADDLPYKQGEMLVRFANPAASTQTKNSILSSAVGCSGSTVVKDYSIVPGLTLVKLPTGTTVEQARISLAQSLDILYSGPNYKVKTSVIPNDTSFSDLWGMNNTGQTGGTVDADIDAPEAWNLKTGSSSIVVAVIDTGVDYTHPDLSANRWVNTGEIPSNGLDDDGDGYVDDVYGYDFVNSDANPMDDEGHGTHVSGTIGAVGNNNLGVAGVCWTVKIMAVKAFNASGSGYLSDIILAIQYAKAKGARVINASWGGYSYSQGLYDAIAAARDAGVLFVASAGNDSIDNDNPPGYSPSYGIPNYPSSYNLSNIISVLATTDTDQMADFSNYGLTSVDLGAPGLSILSTIPGGGYGYKSGTSMAAPHVAGACALFLSADPNLTYTEVKQFLLDYSDPLPSLDGLCVSGGRLNVSNALYEVIYDTVPPLPDPAKWEIVPQATGLHTIAMEAKEATDRSGVEYFFECVTDAGKNSSWQSGTLYQRGDFSANTAYTFRVKYRDQSEFHSETGWSDPCSTTTANGSDTLPPFPSTSRWKISPKVQRLRPTPRIGMEAMVATDETGPVKYYFTCIDVNGTGPNPSFDSGWITSNVYTISSGLTLGRSYTFRVKTRDAVSPTPNETAASAPATVTVSSQGGNVLTVPAPYATIQSAIDHAGNGDIVEVRPYPLPPYTYTGIGNYDIDFKGKAIVVRSLDPNDPNTVAATVIDCEERGRAFIFQNGEDHNSVVTGFTIINGSAVFNPRMPHPTPFGYGVFGISGDDAEGGAIACFTYAPDVNTFKPSQPIIRNCIIRNCVAWGRYGGNGRDGANMAPGADGSTDGNPRGSNGPPGGRGGDGGDGGDSRGGALYFESGSPQVVHCQIINCAAIGGNAGDGANGGGGGNGGNGANGRTGTEVTPPGGGGDGGDGGRGGNGGNGSTGGDANGGAIYFRSGCLPTIVDCDINDCYTINGLGSHAGDAGDGGNGGNGGAAGTGGTGSPAGGDGGNGGEGGTGGYEGFDGDISYAGAIYYEYQCHVTIVSTTIINNMILINDSGYRTGGSGGDGGIGGNGGTPNGSCGEGGGGGNGSSGGGGGLGGTLPSGDLRCSSGDPGAGYPSFDAMNITTLRGGGDYYEYECAADIIACTISDNNAVGQNYFYVVGWGGGEYYEPNCAPVFNYCRIEDNNAGVDGGGIYFNTGGTSKLNFCDVSGNVAAWAGGGIRGGDFEGESLGFAVDVCDCNFSANDALFGGGMYLEEAIMTIVDSNFSGNTAFEGAGAWDFNCTATVKDCTVRNNSASLGGGFSFINGLATIDNSVMTGNDANASIYSGGTGGAMFFEGWSDFPHQVTNCLITDNTAYAYGGGLSNNRGAWVQINNCTFVGNEVIGPESVGGGVSSAEYWAWVDISNSILWGNKAVAGGSQIAVGSPYGSYPYGDGPFADVNVSYSDVQGGEDGVWLEDETQTFTALWWLDGNIDEDPCFVGGYYLSQILAGQDVNSPCVDSGSDDANAPGIGLDTYTTRTDSWGDTNDPNNPDPNSVIVDMGYHYKLFVAPQYQLTSASVAVSGLDPNDQPVIDPNGGHYRYQYTVVHLTVSPPPPDYEVLWTGTDDDTLTGTENTVLMDRNKTVTVTFVRNVCELMTGVVGFGGTIMPAGGTYLRGTVVTLTATPDTSWRVKAWSGTDNDSSTAATNTVIMNSNRTVTVEFEQLKTLIVAAGGGQQGYYSTIQDAVADAQNGDAIVVYPGLYHGSLGISLYVDKSIMITSLHPDDPCCVAATVIDGYNLSPFNEGYNNIGVTFGPSTDSNTIFNGFTIQNCGGSVGLAQAGQRTPENHPNGYDGGIFVGPAIRVFGGGPVIKNCIIRDNLIIGGIGGLGVGATTTENAGRGGWGGGAWGGAVYCGSYFGTNSSPTFINCRIIDNFARGGNGGNGGDDAFPGGEENYGGNWSMRGTPEYPARDIDPYSLNMTPVTDADLWEVWNTYPDNPGYVGDYRWYSGIGGGVFIDEGSNVTFIDCEISGNRALGGMSGRGGLDNFSQRPEEPLIPYEIPSFGGGVYCAADSTVTFTGCTITDNISSEPNDPPNNSIDPYLGHGGGVCAEDTAKLIFTNCTFSRNDADAGGGLHFTNANAVISDCNFTFNSAFQGGGLFGEHGPATILRSIFTGNIAASEDAPGVLGMGGGLHLWATDVNIIDCNISGNQADSSGGGVFFGGDGTPSLINCLLTNNTAGRDGGGLSVNWYALSLVTNCTIVGNEATGDFGELGKTGLGGGIYSSYHSYSVILNSILWNNSALRGNELAVGTGFEYDPRPSTVDVSYSDVKGGQPYVFVDSGCILNWGIGNIQVDPCFVTGPLGSYYLSQTDTNAPNQTADSPCVDTGNDQASNVGLSYPYTTRTDEVFDTNVVDMGYHYMLAHPIDLCSFCDLSHDGDVDLVDFAIFSLHWLNEDCSSDNNWCGGADLTFDSRVNSDDLALLFECWLAEDTDAPLPNPSKWKIMPYSTAPPSPYTVSMTAETAFDSWGGVVEYYFECVTGNDSNSGWNPSTTYVTTGHLDPNTTFGYRVKARDGSGHETLWSEIGYAVTGQSSVDHTPPTPVTWALFPAAVNSTSITMTSTTSTDATSPPVQYYFECTSDGNRSSSWQGSSTYVASSLTPSTLYTFKVKAHDSAAPPNETGWSTEESATTLVQNLAPLNPGWAVIPYETGTSPASAHMTANVATDPEGTPVQYYFECIDYPAVFSGNCSAPGGFSSGWINTVSPQTWDVCLDTPGQGYRFRFKVRDTSAELKESGWSSTVYCYP